MKILYIGGGFVGACAAAVSADSGHDTLVYDLDKKKMEMLGSNNREKIEGCLLEKGLAELLLQNKDKIVFTSNYKMVEDFLEEVDVIFMCLPTPEKNGAQGESDLSYYLAAAEKLAMSLVQRNSGQQKKYAVIVNKSTVPINMVDATEEIMTKAGVKNYGVVSNPEFLIEGKAIGGSVHPDRVVIGAWQKKDFEIMRQVYRRFCDSTNVKYIEVNPKEAAAAKLLVNYTLFSRLTITFDVIGRLCESFNDVKFENIRGIVISDNRVGKWGFYDSVYAGGSCFIKDAASLAHQMEESGANAAQIRQTLNSNAFQRDHFYSRAQKESKFIWKDKTIAILGAAFKQDTNDIRNSPALDILEHLVDDGVKKIRVYDPAALPMLRQFLSSYSDVSHLSIEYCLSENEALAGTNACLILTDWPQFRGAGDVIKNICSAPYLIMDGRRMLAHQYDELQNLGYDIIAVGSPFIKGKK